jgi:hypothetical protein
MNLNALLLKSGQIIILFLLIFLNYSTANSDARQDLETLRDRCLYYAIGHAPNDSTAKTIRYGLYPQSPFSVPDTEIDIAASGFSLATLPSAVENNLIAKNAAENIAKIAAQRVKDLVEKSAFASSQQEYEKYGFKGMLYHYYVWSENDEEFQGKNGVEVSSIDTALLMFGLLVCGNYFEGDVLKDYRDARDLISWKEWLETSTPDHVNQFRMSWKEGSFSEKWWDWRSEETMLICLFAAMSDSTLDIIELWYAWNKKLVTYISPAPDSKTFTCYATWNGDPFTVFYGAHFFKFRNDIYGLNWYSQSEIEYKGHVEFFKKERGYLDHMTFAFSDGSEGAIAEPKCSPDIPITRTDCPIYSLAGGLDYYSKDPNANPIANTISSLVQKEDFFEWTGWPPESVDAKSSTHKTFNVDIIAQNIASIAISIDNYLTGIIRNLVMQDSDMKRVLNIIMPTTASPECEGDLNNDGNVDELDLELSAPDFGRSDCEPGDICAGDFNADNDVDGKDLRQLIFEFGRTDCPLIRITDHSARAGAPAWSPNNSKIAFRSD